MSVKEEKGQCITEFYDLVGKVPSSPSRERKSKYDSGEDGIRRNIIRQSIWFVFEKCTCMLFTQPRECHVSITEHIVPF